MSDLGDSQSVTRSAGRGIVARARSERESRPEAALCCSFALVQAIDVDGRAPAPPSKAKADEAEGEHRPGRRPGTCVTVTEPESAV